MEKINGLREAFIMALKICSLNAQGLNNIQKRGFLFQFLRDSNFDIIALQETHATNNTAVAWQDEWTGPSVWNNKTNNSCGVAILTRPGLACDISDVQNDTNGRIVALTLKYENYNLRLISIYAPNPENRLRSANFFSQIESYSKPEMENIILGDFNMVENVNIDREGGRPREIHTYGLPELRQLKTNLKITDIWREKNPHTRSFTWRSFYDNIHSRLDRIYFPCELVPLVTQTTSHPFPWSDHHKFM